MQRRQVRRSAAFTPDLPCGHSNANTHSDPPAKALNVEVTLPHHRSSSSARLQKHLAHYPASPPPSHRGQSISTVLPIPENYPFSTNSLYRCAGRRILLIVCLKDSPPPRDGRTSPISHHSFALGELRPVASRGACILARCEPPR